MSLHQWQHKCRNIKSLKIGQQIHCTNSFFLLCWLYSATHTKCCTLLLLKSHHTSKSLLTRSTGVGIWPWITWKRADRWVSTQQHSHCRGISFQSENALTFYSGSWPWAMARERVLAKHWGTYQSHTLYQTVGCKWLNTAININQVAQELLMTHLALTGAILNQR